MKNRYIQLHEENNNIIGVVLFNKNYLNLHKVKEALQAHFDAEIEIVGVDIKEPRIEITIDVIGDIETYQDVIYGSETWLYL